MHIAIAALQLTTVREHIIRGTSSASSVMLIVDFTLSSLIRLWCSITDFFVRRKELYHHYPDSFATQPVKAY
jgi:hypothetical protein